MIANIDENMGRLEAFLKETGLRENTILVFMTDNGTATGQDVFNAGMRGKKASLYDGGHRVPFFVRWPNAGIGGGTDIPGLTRSTDFLPTLIDLCGLSTEEGLTFDGVSLAPCLLEGTPPPAERMAVVQYGHPNEGVWGYSERDASAVLWQHWRLVNGCELYDVQRDPGQQNDVAEQHADIVRKLHAHYAKWWDTVGWTLDTYQPITIGSAHENPMRLCSCDWAWVYADNQHDIRNCVMDSGTWHVDVARAGRFSLILRRWPEESGLGIAAPAPVMQGVDGSYPEGKALPVSSAWLQAGACEIIQPVPEHETDVTFETEMARGPTTIQSWWRDTDGTQLAGAYYLTAKRL